MSESFMDPTTVSNVAFSRDPIPNFRRLAEGNLSGNVLVPVVGGGTANVELEFLLTSPHVFYGSRLFTPFDNANRFFDRELRTSVPWMFKENGYRTVAVHPFQERFYRRNVIYPMLGFEQYIAEEQMPDAWKKGQFISDAYFTDVIINQIKQAEDDGTPLFLFGISMQNHWDYEPTKYGGADWQPSVTATSQYLSRRDIGVFNSYLQGIFDADVQLGRLAEFLDTLDTPTILVFFGDHLPIMGMHDNRVWEQLGWITHQYCHSWTLEDKIKLFHTPYLVWANYEREQDDWGDMSTFMLSARVAQLSGIPLNRYVTYVLNAGQFFRGITEELYLDIHGNVHSASEHRNKPHILAFEAMFQAMKFDDDDFSRSLTDMMN
jgi:hypothetical protein